jgi:hypothetical protein
LPLSQFNQLEDFFHLHQGLPHGLDDLGHFRNGPADGGTTEFLFRDRFPDFLRRRRNGWRFSRFDGSSNRLGFSGRQWPESAAASAPAATAAATDAGAFGGLRRIRFWLIFLGHLKAKMAGVVEKAMEITFLRTVRARQ